MTACVREGCVVAIDYSVRLTDGRTIETSRDRGRVDYLHGTGQLLPGLEKAIDGMREGESASFALEPKEAYGVRDTANVVSLPRALFSEGMNVTPGACFSVRTSAGRNYPVTVVDVSRARVVVDLNHPLAGERLFFDVAIREVREATDGEVFRGTPQPVEHV